MGFTLDLPLRWSLILNPFSYRDIFQILFIQDLHSNIVIQYKTQDTFFQVDK